MNSYQSEYLRIWKKAFAKFLGWREEQTLLWARRLLEEMVPPGMVINEPPLYYVARELAWTRPYYEEFDPAERDRLVRAVEAVLSSDYTLRDFQRGFGIRENTERTRDDADV